MSTKIGVFMNTAKGMALAGVLAATVAAVPGPVSANPFAGAAAGVMGPYRQEMARLGDRIGALAEVERRVKALNDDLEWATQALMEVTGEVEVVIVDEDRITPRQQLRLIADVLTDGLARMRRDQAFRNVTVADGPRVMDARLQLPSEGLSGLAAKEADLVASIDAYSAENEAALETINQVSKRLDIVILAADLKDSDELKAFDTLVEAMDLLPGGDGQEASEEEVVQP